jgi:hypothetical protein
VVAVSWSIKQGRFNTRNLPDIKTLDIVYNLPERFGRVWRVENKFPQPLRHVVQREIDGTKRISELITRSVLQLNSMARARPSDPHLVRDHVDKVFLSLLQMLGVRRSLQQEPLSGLSLGAGLQRLQPFRFGLNSSQSGAQGVAHRVDILGCRQVSAEARKMSPARSTHCRLDRTEALAMLITSAKIRADTLYL